MTNDPTDFPADTPVSNRLYAIADIFDEEAVARGKLELSKEEVIGVAKYLRETARDARAVEVQAQGGAKVFVFKPRAMQPHGGDAA